MTWDRGPDAERKEKLVVVISRHWGNPEIKITVNQDKIELMANINDFVDALLQEVGNPFWLLTRAQLKNKVRNSAVTVYEKIKQSSAQVM